MFGKPHKTPRWHLVTIWGILQSFQYLLCHSKNLGAGWQKSYALPVPMIIGTGRAYEAPLFKRHTPSPTVWLSVTFMQISHSETLTLWTTVAVWSEAGVVSWGRNCWEKNVKGGTRLLTKERTSGWNRTLINAFICPLTDNEVPFICCPYTAERREVLGFLLGGDFAPRGPRDCPRAKPRQTSRFPEENFSVRGSIS